MIQTVLSADSMNNEEPDITVEEQDIIVEEPDIIVEVPDITVEVPNIVAVPDIITEKQDSIEKVPDIIVGELSVKHSSISSAPVVTTPKFDVNVYRQASRKTRKNLETIVDDLVAMKSPVKNKVATNYLSEIKKVLTHVPVQSVNEGVIVDGVLNHLEDLKNSKQFNELHRLLHKLFGEYTANLDVMSFIARKLNITHVQRFLSSAEKWRDSSFSYKRTPSSQEERHLIYNTWISNAVVSTDRNTMVRMRKRLYLQKFGNIVNEEGCFGENKKQEKYFVYVMQKTDCDMYR